MQLDDHALGVLLNCVLSHLAGTHAAAEKPCAAACNGLSLRCVSTDWVRYCTCDSSLLCCVSTDGMICCAGTWTDGKYNPGPPTAASKAPATKAPLKCTYGPVSKLGQNKVCT